MPGTEKRKRSVAILGATGSVGSQTLAVIEHLQRIDTACEWSVRSLSCSGSVDKLAEAALKHRPFAVCCAEEHAARLEGLLAGSGIDVLSGDSGLQRLASDPEADIVLLAIFGTAALIPLMSAIESGREVALASKEALIAGGHFVMEAARRHGTTFRPVDSEHSALWQCLMGHERAELSGVTITASGGPFRGRSRAELENVSYEEALQHPVWSMGAGITVNSATLFNKGLEVIEAQHLFGLEPDQVDVLVHPQGQLHAMARFVDGSVLCHAASPDMHLPIQLALTHPRRLPGPDGLPAVQLAGWELDQVDTKVFTAFEACRLAMRGPWWTPAALLAVNEELCSAFGSGQAGFLQIGDTLLFLAADPLQIFGRTSSEGLAIPEEPQGVFTVERAARVWARQAIAARSEAAK